MIISLLILTFLKVVSSDSPPPFPDYTEHCIPQGNLCREDWQCCKGFHCEAPIYKEEKHCLADHEQLTHIDEEVSDEYKESLPVDSQDQSSPVKPKPIRWMRAPLP